MGNMKKIYIAGKITGDPDFKAKFKTVEKELTNQGHAVLNPVELPGGLHYEDYMDICFAMLDVADTIYLLHDYKDSPGALRELERAKRKGKEAIFG